MWQKTALDDSEIATGLNIDSTLAGILSDRHMFPGTNRFKAFNKIKGITGVDLKTGLVNVQLSKDKKTQMKFGKYLAGRGFDAKTVRDASSKLKASVEMVNGAKLEYTKDGSEAMDIYERGPSSCMSHSESIRCYDSVDICVAYVKLGDRIVARALATCGDPERLEHTCIYGNKDIMEPLLEKAGYVCGNFDGLTIDAIETCGSYYAPYRDDGTGYEDSPCNGRLGIVTYGIGGSNTNGILANPCERCGEPMDEEDSQWSDYHEEQMCHECFSDHHAYIESMGEYYATESDDIVEVDGEWHHIEHDTICYSEHESEYLLRDDAVYSDYDGDYFKSDDVVEAIILIHGEPEPCHSSNCIELENEEGEEVWVHDDISSRYEYWVTEQAKQLKLELEED